MTDEKRKKKSANYALEQMVEQKAEDTSPPIWREIKDEFVSPESALEYAKQQKIQGVIRVVRIASEVFGGSVVTPEPIYTLSKLSGALTEKKARKGRTKKATVEAPPAAPVTPVEPPPVAPAGEPEPIPPEPSDADLDATGQ